MSLKDLKSRTSAAMTKAVAETSERAAPSVLERVERRPVTSPGAMALMQPALDALNERAKRAEAELAERVTELALEQLVEVPGRKRALTPAEFDELRANLAANPMIHPVVVRPQVGRKDAQGRPLYEVISGYNRLAVYRLLDRATIPVRSIAMERDDADDASFWANLLQPSLPDYEKYQGFKRVQERTGLNQVEMARKAGVSRSMVSMIFAFEGLPRRALEVLAERPHILGASRAADLARIAREGRSEQVILAIEQIASGRITQEQAVTVALLDTPAAPGERRTVKASTIQIRRGRSNFCRLVSRGTSLRLEFMSEDDRARADEIVERVIREMAQTAGAEVPSGSDSGSP